MKDDSVELNEPAALSGSIFKKVFSIEPVHANLPFPEVPSSSFGNNPLSVYLGQSDPSQLKSVTVYWPSGGITQTNLLNYSGTILHLMEKN